MTLDKGLPTLNLDDVLEARQRIGALVVRTPLLRLQLEAALTRS